MLNTAISNVRIATTLKTVARNVSSIVKEKESILKKINDAEAQYKEMFEKKIAKFKEKYDALCEQQEIFERPIRELTGGYSTEDLVTVETVETGVDKNGNPTKQTRYLLKYPETIIPPTDTEDAVEETAHTEDIQPEREGQPAPFESVDKEELPLH